MSKRFHLEKIQNKKFIMSSILFTVIFAILFLYVKDKTKFNFKEPIILTNNLINNNLLISEIEKKDRELKYKEIKNKILAKSYLVLDLNSKKILISQRENESLPLASVSKLMTAYTALNYCNDNLKLELDKILIASDNESADYVANNCPNYEEFVKSMNNLAKKNNLDMTFVNPSGLDINDETEASNYGTASSIAKLINLVYTKNPNILSHTTKQSYYGIKNTNENAKNTPFLIGSKTGYTEMAGGNLVTIYEVGPGSKFAIVVLGSTKESRFTDTNLLLDYYLKSK